MEFWNTLYVLRYSLHLLSWLLKYLYRVSLKTRIVPKTSFQKCNQCRKRVVVINISIAITSILYKVMKRIVNSKLSNLESNDLLSDRQNGFHTGDDQLETSRMLRTPGVRPSASTAWHCLTWYFKGLWQSLARKSANQASTSMIY